MPSAVIVIGERVQGGPMMETATDDVPTKVVCPLVDGRAAVVGPRDDITRVGRAGPQNNGEAIPTTTGLTNSFAIVLGVPVAAARSVLA